MLSFFFTGWVQVQSQRKKQQQTNKQINYKICLGEKSWSDVFEALGVLVVC
jgi:hypothetical protein